MIKPYFPSQSDQPSPLTVQVKRHVRFEELDPLGIVWHGCYASFFEDARTDLGIKYGVGYLDFYKHDIKAPLKIMHIDYHYPLRFQEIFTIEAIQHWTEAARINIEFIIRNSEGKNATTGYTVQMMLDANDNILTIPPPFYMEFLNKWKSGVLR